MKLNTPLPQPLPKECAKAAKIFKSFVDSGNNGLDGVIPRNVLQNAKGFAIFTIFKAGFLFSARAGTGVVIARLEDGSWSAPSAIGSAGLGVGGQAGAEMTDFLVVLNSRSAVRTFMSAGSLTLGGNMSIAVGPLGRNGEAIGSVNSSGKMAAMYSYSKTRGLFGGVSIEGSVIVERQDANAQAYHSDVSAKSLLSGAITPPEWAMPLIRTLEACTGMPGNRPWVEELRSRDTPYAFDGIESPRNEHPTPLDLGADALSGAGSPQTEFGVGARPSAKNRSRNSSFGFPPASWGKRKTSGAYFENDFHDPSRAPVPSDLGALDSSPGSRRAWEDQPSQLNRGSNPTTGYFDTRFDSDYVSDEQLRRHPNLSVSGKAPARSSGDNDNDLHDRNPFGGSRSNGGLDTTSHRRVFSAYAPSSLSSVESHSQRDPFESRDDLDDLSYSERPAKISFTPKIAPKAELSQPLKPQEGVARAIALYNFKAVQPGDLSFTKGQVITVTKKSGDVNTWWTGKLEGREGIFPANFVEVV
ncbi:uncharacterized protein B0H18DRAFT_1115914 [Fomitopsis serialis]|uniref:uncharacterized protein n=1 Tax=Fomitopsis serialis TaxID=139415 RepID=UPI00200830B2|nr:uncharacterized protein B0H18DRAFT_1115914 [Neoantrodia serialis]KAH9932224.1 hypothetical protein B0H18DRAFT_1115914 [Neoantrodia serialis]